MKFTAGLLRLRRPMCGRPVAFRESPPNQSGLCPGGRAQPLLSAHLNANNQRAGWIAGRRAWICDCEAGGLLRGLVNDHHERS
ncbi:MAG TPA: hypothetical protein VFV58_12905 [Blastocatellia bacterium]|nr:hypothetical protein [Blastocatellia bacterium]